MVDGYIRVFIWGEANEDVFVDCGRRYSIANSIKSHTTLMSVNINNGIFG